VNARLLSVNLAVPGTLSLRGRRVRTGIFKEPAAGRLRLGRLGLEGDFQADKRYHGGPEQALYAYAAEHAAHWSGAFEFPGGLPPGWFGENLTTEGMREETTAVGDVYRIGSALVSVTKPRSPCFKLGLRAGKPSFVRAFLESGRIGFYLRVREEGGVEAGDAIELVERPASPLLVSELIRLLYFPPVDPEMLDRAIVAGGLPPAVRDRLTGSRAAAFGLS
jgi:MOSC domain-containing protein YiiM